MIRVALDNAGSDPDVISLPSGRRLLCRILARALPAGMEENSRVPGRTAVVVHAGPGPGGDEPWPGLSWALTLLLAGPGRGLLMDARGTGGELSSRLCSMTSGIGWAAGWHSLEALPVPGPGLAARFPVAGGVRWWGWAEGPGTNTHRAPARTDLADCLDVARETFPWTLLDVGRDLGLAQDWAARGLPVIACLPPRGAEQFLADADDRWTPLLSRAGHRARSPRGALGLRAEAVPFTPADWAGGSISAWTRSSRSRAARSLGAAVGLRLEAAAPLPRDPAGYLAAGRSGA